MQQFIAEDNSSLLDLLAKKSPNSSKTTLRSWIKEGRVTVDGQIAKQGNDPINKGQQIALTSKQHLIEGTLRIFYEDAHFVANEKPVGLLSVATAFDKTETAHALVKRHYHPHKVYVVHRIDQDTSGVMLFALSEDGYNNLKELFKEHDIQRSYYAVVEGKLSPPKGTWQSYLYEDSQYVVHSTDDPAKGTIAITHYEVQKTSPRYTLLKLTLETGRKNQIRVHCRESGCPVVGDKKYGAVTNPIKRLCLHAATLEFAHPITGKKMSFNSPIPEKFYSLL